MGLQFGTITPVLRSHRLGGLFLLLYIAMKSAYGKANDTCADTHLALCEAITAEGCRDAWVSERCCAACHLSARKGSCSPARVTLRLEPPDGAVVSPDTPMDVSLEGDCGLSCYVLFFINNVYEDYENVHEVNCCSHVQFRLGGPADLAHVPHTKPRQWFSFGATVFVGELPEDALNPFAAHDTCNEVTGHVFLMYRDHPADSEQQETASLIVPGETFDLTLFHWTAHPAVALDLRHTLSKLPNARVRLLGGTGVLYADRYRGRAVTAAL